MCVCGERKKGGTVNDDGLEDVRGELLAGDPALDGCDSLDRMVL